MEADREFKHLCKLCNKRFPCGRSLGGHMRSHLINSEAENGENLKKIKLRKAGSNFDKDKFVGDGVSDGYRLRKNPKKTSRLGEFSGEDRFCRECGKSFESWKGLFGHMKCHSTERERVCSNLEEFDRQSGSVDDEIGAANGGKICRRQTRYMAAENSSSFSFANAAAAASSSVCDQNDEEEEEVALCLMMLSRDVSGFCSTNNSMPKQVPSLFPKTQFSKVVEAIPSVCMVSKMVKLKEVHNRKLKLNEMEYGYLKFGGPDSEFSDSIAKMNKNNDERYGSSSNNPPQLISSMLNSEERNWLKRSGAGKEVNFERKREKRRKYECNCCKKSFKSYQALGGHRASHKKPKEWLGSSKTEESSEKSMETEQESSIQMGYEKKSRKHHQCSICLKTFRSGQALGGHKRSHLIKKLERREYLDLNLPAPMEEGVGSIQPWWVAAQHDSLLGFI